MYQGAKLFYLSGMVHGDYQKTEIHNLGRFISVMKFRPLVWRTTHPYLLADRLEDVTDPEMLRLEPKTDRKISLYGYLRGTNMKGHQAVHLAGVGDFSVKSMTFLPDPCPLPEGIKKRTLVEKDKSIYAPMSGVGGIVYDKDAVYIDLGGSHAHHNKGDESDFVQNMVNTETTINDKLQESEMRLFSGSKPLKSGEIEVTSRRKAVFDEEDESDDDDDSDTEPPKKKIRNDSESLSKNQQLLKEIGDDIGEDTDEDMHESDIEESEASNISNFPSHKNSAPRQLASEKDKKILSKISDVLSNIKDDVDSEEESEDEEIASEGSDHSNEAESDQESELLWDGIDWDLEGHDNLQHPNNEFSVELERSYFIIRDKKKGK